MIPYILIIMMSGAIDTQVVSNRDSCEYAKSVILKDSDYVKHVYCIPMDITGIKDGKK